MRRTSKGTRGAGLALLFLTPMLGSSADREGTTPQAAALKRLQWRPIGPANMGGRVTDIVGIPGDPKTYYVAGADGGVFKTTNGGTVFKPLFTGQRAYSVGALALAPSDPNVVWLGSGEGDPRNSVGYGNGVYRSLDGGETWTHLGLKDSERIKRIVVDPRDPDVALVCALGHAWGPNEERGVFKTSDGGRSWRKVLYRDPDSGCSDIAMEGSNPRILYAGMWTFRRKPWRFDDGGGETALHRSLDGGESWERLSKGLPKGDLARIGVSIAQSSPNIVYMITESLKEGTLFRSEDRGESWRMVHDDRRINFRPFYYSDIRVDPSNPDHLYSLSGGLYKSTDGGKEFERIASDVHGDHQALWIDPLDSDRVLSGSDGGYQVSYDAGSTWDIVNNVELSQFYQVFLGDDDPYSVCGGLQDNGTWCGPSRTLRTSGILKSDWFKITGGDGYYAVPVPGRPHQVYTNLQGGVIFFTDLAQGVTRTIHPYPKIIGSAGDAIAGHKYRFNWDSPIHISPHDPDTVYFGGNVLFRSSTQGYSWDEISPDLTTNDKAKQQSSGGEIYADNTAAEFHCTILTIAESPVEAGVIWVGTDDGNVQLTRDGGKSWANLKDNIEGLPPFSWIAKIEASWRDAGTAYVAVDDHRSDIFKPLAYKTTDFGATWTAIHGGLPQDDYVKVLREDPRNPNLLYAGMEHGVYASWDAGSSWSSIANNLPPVSVRDIKIHPRDHDLVVATHGRGIWILDDIRPLQDLDEALAKDVHLFPVRQATRWQINSRDANLGQRTYKAPNPEYGAGVHFYLKSPPEKGEDAPKMAIEILDSAGGKVRRLEVEDASPGVNRVVWDLNREGVGERASGPRVSPGRFLAVLSIGDQSWSANFSVRPDPRVQASAEDYSAQEKASLELHALQEETESILTRVRRVVERVSSLEKTLREAAGPEERDPGNLPEEIKVDEALSLLAETRKAFESFRDEELTRPISGLGYRQRPRLREEIRSLLSAIDGSAARPSEPQLLRIGELKSETDQAIETYRRLKSQHVDRANQALKALPAVLAEGI